MFKFDLSLIERGKLTYTTCISSLYCPINIKFTINVNKPAIKPFEMNLQKVGREVICTETYDNNIRNIKHTSQLLPFEPLSIGIEDYHNGISVYAKELKIFITPMTGLIPPLGIQYNIDYYYRVDGSTLRQLDVNVVLRSYLDSSYYGTYWGEGDKFINMRNGKVTEVDFVA